MSAELMKNFEKLQQYYFKKPIDHNKVELLTKGFSFAKNYRFEHEGKSYFARFMSPKQSLESREKECLITDYVGKIGIGPKVYYHDAKEGILLIEFLEGRTAKIEDMIKAPNRDLIISQITKVHQISEPFFPKAPTVSYFIQTTLKQSEKAVQLFEDMNLMSILNRLYEYEAQNNSAVLIHGDFNPNNIIIHNGKVNFIDWTDAGLGEPFADISWHAIFFPVTSHDQLLQYYFCTVDDLMRNKLISYFALRLFLRIAWSVQHANLIKKNSEHLLIEQINQKSLPEPNELMVDLSAGKMSLDNFDNLIFYGTTMLNCLTRLAKTDRLQSAIEDLN